MRDKSKISLGLIIFFLVICSITTASGQTTFTPSQLSQYDGKGGNRAYVALKGVVYDVSVAKLWVNGSHTAVCTDCVAGTDITSLWEFAPLTHSSPGFMAVFPRVGILVAEPPPAVTPPPVTTPAVTPSPATTPEVTPPPAITPAVTPSPATTTPVVTLPPTDDNTPANAEDSDSFLGQNALNVVLSLALVVALYLGFKNYRKKVPPK